jgi:DnaJ-class molecular chaperone
VEYRDYYATLGVPREATQADIKKAFRKLARRYHPDVNKGDATAEQRFKEVNEANAVLGDPEKRRLYDRLGADWEQIQRAQAAGARSGGAGGGPFGYGGGGPAYAAGGPGVRFEFHGDPEDLAGFSDFFQTFFGASMAGTPTRGRQRGDRGGPRTATASRQTGGGLDFESILAGLGLDGTGGATSGPAARTAPPRTAPLERQHLQAKVDVSLEEAYAGTSRLVQVGDKRLEVSIPKGVRDGQRIRLSGKAGTGPGAGNVYLDISLRDHPVFSREGDDLRREVALSLSEALLGAEVPVGTLKGRVLLKVPPSTQNGRVFRLAGQGMPRFRAEGFGDLFVKVRVILPSALDAEARDLFKTFADHVHQPDPRATAATGSGRADHGATAP